ncbi:MAG: 1,4-alpha-glucan branching enzyme, partial [Clostridia bacterium]|nr:1,4-alpha-glucan branching enzyme [Clostridia bacterium]
MVKVFEQSFPLAYTQGLSYDCYRYLGNHIIDTARIAGMDLWTVSFAVWAPEASAVHVCGTFNQWGQSFVEGADMHLVSEGIWYTEISGIRAGDCYYYQITNSDHTVYKQMDPFAKSCVFQPELAAVIDGADDFLWTDGTWMGMRSKIDPAMIPINIYELHLGSWVHGGGTCSYRSIADQLIRYVLDMHYTHVSFMSLCEYPFDGSLGYQVGGFYAVTGRYGTPEDFKYLVNRLHEAGIGVLMDWIPGYFVKEPNWLYRFGGTWQYESAIENFRENPYLGTISFDLSKGSVRSFLISSGLYWLQEYHLDGLCVKSLEHILYHDFERSQRVEPKNIYGGRENLEGVSFVRDLNIAARERVPGAVMIADDRSDWPMVTKPVYLGGLGFDFRWNRSWRHETLEYMGADPVYRSYLHGKMIVHASQGLSGNSVLPIDHQDVTFGRKTLLCKMFG